MTEEADRAAKEHTSGMIAFMLEPSDSKALLSAVPPELAVDDDVLHLTLMYLGDIAAFPEGVQDLAATALQLFAMDSAPVAGRVGGAGRFNDIDPKGTSALYASFDAAELPAFRERLVAHMAQVGIVSPSEHGFTPHITFAYLPPGAQQILPDVPALELTFRGITLAWGDAQFYFPLSQGYGLAAEPSFQVAKGLDGRMHWVLISSNSFQDREREIVSQKALEADVERADRDGDYGTLDWWHLDGFPDKTSGEPTPLAVLGRCTGNAMHGRMLIEWGDFVSEEIGQAVKTVAPELAASIAFLYPKGEPDAQGVYHHIRRYSRALLPRRFASNPLTALPIIVQEEKHMVKEKVEALRLVLGGSDELVNKVLALAGSKEQTALEAGVRHKEADAETGDPAQKATITVSDDDKPAEDKPKDEKPAEPAAAAEQPAEGEPAAAAEPPPADNTIGKYTEQQLAEYVAKCMDAWAEKRDAQQTQQQAAKEARDAELLQTIKEQGDKLEHILKEAQDAKAGAATALMGVAELKGETPRAQKGHRASKEGPEPSGEIAQTQGPEADPLHKHMAAIFANGANPVPGR